MSIQGKQSQMGCVVEVYDQENKCKTSKKSLLAKPTLKAHKERFGQHKRKGSERVLESQKASTQGTMTQSLSYLNRRKARNESKLSDSLEIKEDQFSSAAQSYGQKSRYLESQYLTIKRKEAQVTSSWSLEPSNRFFKKNTNYFFPKR